MAKTPPRFDRRAATVEQLKSKKAPVSATPSQRPAAATESDEDDVSVGFIATAAAVVFACIGGVYLFMNWGTETAVASTGPAYRSIIESTCGEGWEKDLSNVDQMYCFMTTQVSRLCDKDERRHLVATVGRFQKDYAVWNARFHAASMGSIVKVQAQSIPIGLETARMERTMRDPKASAEEKAKRMEEVADRMSDVMSGPNRLLSERTNKTPYYKMEDALAELAKSGYIAESDFGRSKPDWVSRGFRAVKTVVPSC